MRRDCERVGYSKRGARSHDRTSSFVVPLADDNSFVGALLGPDQTWVTPVRASCRQESRPLDGRAVRNNAVPVGVITR